MQRCRLHIYARQGGSDAMGGLQRRVSLPKEVVASPGTPVPKNAPSTSTSAALPIVQKVPSEGSAIARQSTGRQDDPRPSGPSRLVLRRARLIRTASPSYNPNMIAQPLASHPDHTVTHLNVSSDRASSSSPPLGPTLLPGKTGRAGALAQRSDDKNADSSGCVLIPSTKSSRNINGTSPSSRNKQFESPKSSPALTVASPAIGLHSQPEYPTQMQAPRIQSEGPHTGAQAMSALSGSISEQLSRTSTLITETSTETTAEVDDSAADEALKAAVIKKKPGWLGNWGKAADVQASAAKLAGAKTDIITGRPLSSASASKAALLGRRLAGSSDRDHGGTKRSVEGGMNRVSGIEAGSTLPQGPQVVLRGGRWELVGHEEDLKGLEVAVPVLQARLTAGVKAEQEHEREALQKLYSSSSLQRLQKDGLVLTGVTATKSGELYRSVILKFTLPSSTSSASRAVGIPSVSQGDDESKAVTLGNNSEMKSDSKLDSRSSIMPLSHGAANKTAGNGTKDLPYHKFRVGDSVLITQFAAGLASTPRGSGSSIRSATQGAADGVDAHMEGAVLELRKGHLLVAVDHKDAEAMDRASSSMSKQSAGLVTWRLDQSIRDTTAQRQIEAVKKLDSFVDPYSPSEKLIRCVLVGSRNTPLIAEQPPLWVRDASWREDARAELAGQTGLNSSQRRAVAKAMVSSLTLWQGPPGTGKTRTLLALMDVLVNTSAKTSRRWQSMGTVLACADTNAAVDNLVEGLLARNIRVVRVGNPAKVREHIRHVTLEAQAEASRLGREAVKLREEAKKDIERCREMRSEGQEEIVMQRLGEMEGRARADMARADAVLRDAMAEVIDNAQVVCATCTGAGDSTLADRLFHMVVIDEATQATEPAVLIPLTRGAHCVVMAGDPKQLPPTIVSQEAYKFALDVTLFDRISDNGVFPLLLDTQYRMNPGISEFPSRWFYKSKLQDGVSASDKPIPAGIHWPVPTLPVAIVPVEDGEEERANTMSAAGFGVEGPAGKKSISNAAGGRSGEGGDGGMSYRNVAEARIALQAVHTLLTAGDAESAAILTPYRGQVRCLETLMRQLGSAFEGLNVIISSVDGYQGREADVVVFSAVRCNRHGSVGFVSDPRRLNVAITRPRRGLVVVCSPSTLRKGSKDWDAYLEWALSKNLILDRGQIQLPPWVKEGRASSPKQERITDDDISDTELAVVVGNSGQHIMLESPTAVSDPPAADSDWYLSDSSQGPAGNKKTVAGLKKSLRAILLEKKTQLKA